MFGTVSHDSVDGETKVSVIFADGNSWYSEWFNTEDLININDIFDFSLSGEQVWERYIKYGEALTRKQRYYISWKYDLWLKENSRDIISWI